MNVNAVKDLQYSYLNISQNFTSLKVSEIFQIVKIEFSNITSSLYIFYIYLLSMLP